MTPKGTALLLTVSGFRLSNDNKDLSCTPDDGPGPGAYEPYSGNADGPAFSMAGGYHASTGALPLYRPSERF